MTDHIIYSADGYAKGNHCYQSENKYHNIQPTKWPKTAQPIAKTVALISVLLCVISSPNLAIPLIVARKNINDNVQYDTTKTAAIEKF